MKARITMLALIMMVLSSGMFGQTSTSATYSLGNIKSDRGFGNPSQSSGCPGTLTVTIPLGAIITSVNVTYAYEALPGSFRAFQTSQLRCTSPGGVNESTLATNTNYSAGVQVYTRTGLTIANGVTGGGNIVFQLHAGVTYGSQVGCSEQYQRVNNNTWTVTVNYLNPAYPVEPSNPNPATEATNVPVNIGNMTWSFGANSNFYDLYFGTTNPPTNKVVNNQTVSGTTGSYSCGTLNSGTKYYWKVVVRNNFQNEVAGPVWNFSTECSPANTPIMVNFDDLVVPGMGTGNPPPNINPLCWTLLYQCNLAYAAEGVYSTSHAYTAPNCWIASNEGDATAFNIMVMPEMAANLNTLQLSFMGKAQGGMTDVSIGTMSDKNNPATFTELTIVSLTSYYQQFDIPFTAYLGTNKHMAVKFTSPGANQYRYVYIDNVLIGNIPTCPRPLNLTAVNVTQTTATVSWLDPGAATQWNIETVVAGSTPTGNSTPISTKPFTITGLQPATSYDFYLQANCGGGNLSYWSNKGTFTTACLPNSVPVFENFDASTNLSSCWTVLKTVTGSSWNIQSYSGYSLPNCFAMGVTSNDAIVMLLTPPITVPGGSLQDIKLNFFAKRAAFEQSIIVGTISNPLDYNTFTPLKAILPTTNYAEYEIWFNNYTGSDNYIAFKCGNLSTSATLNIDNINLSVLPYCLNPIDLWVNEIHETDARLHWTESREATEWEIEAGPVGFVPGTNTYSHVYTHELVGGDYSFVMTALEPGNFYDVYIRALCGNGDVSLWSPKAQFMSQQESFGALPLIETFDPNFTWTSNAPTNNVNWTLFNTLYHSGPNCARNLYGINNKNVLLISKRIDLSAKSKAYLSFWHIAKTDGDRDHCYVEISTDGGANYDQIPASTYTGLGNYHIPTQNLPEGPCFDEDSYAEWGTGTETPTNTWWRNENFDLSAYSGNSNIVIRFRIVSDNTTNKYGWLMDDISIKTFSGVDTEVNPLSFDVEMLSGETTTETMTITNMGDFPLLYTASVQNFTDGIVTLASQDFEAGLPADWTIINGLKSSSNSWWRWAETGVAQYNLNGTDYMFVGRVYPDTCDEKLISPPFNGVGYSNVFVTFDHVYLKSTNLSAPDYAEVTVWDGTAWHSILYLKTLNVGTWGSPVSFTFDITQYANPEMKIRFYYNGWSGSRWGVDNFKITASDIPLNWLTLHALPSIRGLVQGGESQNITLGITARPTFPEDTWHSEIQFISNDLVNSPLIIPVSMTIGCLQPWNFVQTGQVHSISIPQGVIPQIFGEPLANGDWIGVFYVNDAGQEACGGALQWNGTSGMVMNAYGDDPTTPEKDGFDAGEEFLWRLKRCGNTEQYAATATYDQSMPNTGYFADFGLSKLTALNAAIIQNYSFNQGWNSISSYVVPSEQPVEDLFAPMGANLIILRDLSAMYWPSQNVNTIGNWNNSTGYVLKTNGAVNFDITGGSYAGTSVALTDGWQYLPVLSQCPVDISTMFAGNLENIVIIQELIGSKVFWPAMQVYTLTTLEPGKAYKLKMANGVTISFPDCPAKGANQVFSQENSLKTPWGNVQMTPSTEVVILMESAMSGLMGDDMIGAFDQNGNIFGLTEISGTEDKFTMTLFGHDHSSEVKTGFETNEPVSFRLYRSSTGEEFSLDVVYSDILENTSGTFVAESFAAVSELKMSPTGLGETSGDGIQIFPNPAKDVLNITGITSKTGMSILNIFGEEVYFTELTQSSAIDVSNLAKGTYIVKFLQNQNTNFKKLIIR